MNLHKYPQFNDDFSDTFMSERLSIANKMTSKMISIFCTNILLNFEYQSQTTEIEKQNLMSEELNKITKKNTSLNYNLIIIYNIVLITAI